MPNSAVAALLVTELRDTADALDVDRLAARSLSAIQSMHLWLVQHYSEFGGVFDSVMADRARRGLETYDCWDAYLSDIGCPLAGHLDALQLAAFADVRSRRVTVLAPAGTGDLWHPISGTPSCGSNPSPTLASGELALSMR